MRYRQVLSTLPAVFASRRIRPPARSGAWLDFWRYHGYSLRKSSLKKPEGDATPSCILYAASPDLVRDSPFGFIRFIYIAWESRRWKHKPKTQHAAPLQCILYLEIVRKVKRHGKKATHGKEARLTFRTISQCKIHWRGPHVAFAVCSFSDDFLQL